MRLLLLLVLALAPLLAPLQEARAKAYSLYNRASSGLDIDLFLPWDEIPFDRAGYLPVQLRIENKSPRNGRWVLTSHSNSGYFMEQTSINGRTAVEVPAGEKRTFHLLLPMADARNEQNLRLTLSGTGIDEHVGEYFSSDGYHHGELAHYGGISADLHTEHGGLLDNASGSSGQEIEFADVDPKLCPEDWRGYMAFDTLYFSAKSWDELSSGARRAILDWVSTGGELRLLIGSAPMKKDFSDIPSGARVRSIGLGQVVLFPGGNEELRKQINHTITHTRNNRGREEIETRVAAFDQNYDAFFSFRFDPAKSDHFTPAPQLPNTESMAEKLRQASGESNAFEDVIDIEGANFVIIILSVIAFGVFVGPVNFFMLAKGRNRWRVFITIPIISIVFCMLIVGSIILGDGFGGEGYTSRLVVIDPARKTKTVIQDELSVTGILMSGAFSAPDTATVEHIGSKLPESVMKATGQFDRSGDRYSGDYFESRRLQQNRLLDVSPSREAVILQGDPSAPEVVSNLQASCHVIFIRDEAGKFWKAESLGVGRTVKAEASSAEEFADWWKNRRVDGGALFQTQPNLAGRKGWFYADAQPVQDAYPETLPSIHWKNHQTIIAGPLVLKGGA